MIAPVEEIVSRIDQLTNEELNELEKTLANREKPGEEHQRLVNAIEKTSKERFGDWWRKALKIGIVLGLLALGFIIITYFTRREALAESTRKDEFGADVGYKVEQYRYRDRVLLSFNSGSASSLVYDLSPLSIDKMVQQSWLSNGRAIYLNLSVKPDSKTAALPARIIHDFQRGEIYVYSPLSLWRPNSSTNRWMSEAEFDGVLARFGQ